MADDVAVFIGLHASPTCSDFSMNGHVPPAMPLVLVTLEGRISAAYCLAGTTAWGKQKRMGAMSCDCGWTVPLEAEHMRQDSISIN